MLAKVITDGPGRAYLRESCKSGSHYAFCDYVDELPTNFDAFLFSSESPLWKVTQRLGIEATRAEASKIVINTLLQYPLWQMGQSLINFGDQLIMFRGIEPSLCPTADSGERLKLCLDKWQITKVVAQYFPSELNEFMNSLQNNNRLPFELVYSIDIAVVIFSVVWCASLSFVWWRPGGRPEPLVSDLLAVILVGVLSNAALTGMLSAPQDRYQSRVIWLLPFFIVLYFGRLTGFRPEPSAGAHVAARLAPLEAC
jgi:hypothetical protein